MWSQTAIGILNSFTKYSCFDVVVLCVKFYHPPQSCDELYFLKIGNDQKPLVFCQCSSSSDLDPPFSDGHLILCDGSHTPEIPVKFCILLNSGFDCFGFQNFETVLLMVI